MSDTIGAYDGASGSATGPQTASPSDVDTWNQALADNGMTPDGSSQGASASDNGWGKLADGTPTEMARSAGATPGQGTPSDMQVASAADVPIGLLGLGLLGIGAVLMRPPPQSPGSSTPAPAAPPSDVSASQSGNGEGTKPPPSQANPSGQTGSPTGPEGPDGTEGDKGTKDAESTRRNQNAQQGQNTGQAGEASGLTRGGARQLGNLKGTGIEDKTVAEAIRARGGTAANVNEVATNLRQLKVSEIANKAAQGDPEAVKAMKIIKQASRLGQKH